MGQHINTFNKGMTSDMSVLYQPQGTYRYAKNINLIAQDGENYVVKDCLGNVKLTEINKAYATVTVGPTAVTYQANPMTIGMTSFTNEFVVFSTNAESVDGSGNPVGGYGEIGLLRFTNYGQGIQPVAVAGNDNDGYIPLYHHVDLDFSKLKRIDGFAYEETDEIKRVYWTDNLNQPRVFNVANPIFTTYIANGALVVGQQYMVVEGAITHNAVQYAPGIATGNIFTAANANYTDLLSPSPTAKVIQYYPIELLNFTPNRAMGNIEFKEYGAGSVYCGGKIYFYRLSQPTEGVYTSWSYGSSPIHVGTDNTVTAVPANPFFDFTGGGSSSTLVNSGNSVVLTIDNVDTNYTNIEVAVAEYDQSLDVIRVINIIANELITSVTVTTPSYKVGTTVEITHTGSANLGELTISDITLFPAAILKCKTITTNKNYCLIGNIEERTEFDDFSNTGVTITQIYHRMRTHQSEYGAAGSAQVCENVMSYNIPTNSNVNPSTAANPALVDGIQPYTEWIVTTGVATYNAVAYGPAQAAGQFFRGVLGVYNWANTSGTAVVRPAVFKNKYTTTGGVNKPDGIQFDANESYQWTYRNPAVAHLKKGYWSNQTYRFGILFYDLKGNPFYVRWLGDKTFATPIAQPLTELVQVDAAGDDDWYLKQNGVSISGITIPPSIIDLISGFSIVRAERDATIMTQGMLMQVGFPGSTTFFNMPTPNLAADTTTPNSLGQLLTYVCPDNLVAYPVENYATGSKLSLSHWVIPRTFAGANMKTSSDGDVAIETKYLEIAAAEGAPDPDPNQEILALQDMTEGATVTSFGSGNWQYVNQQQVIGPPFFVSAVDTACSGGSATAIQSCGSIGGPRTLVEIEGAFFGYNQYPATDYGNLAAASVNKLMANVTVEKSTLYGGQTSAALANTFYISTGHFQPITAQVKTDTLSGGNYVFNNVDVWGGDCYNCLITYGHSLYGQNNILNPLGPSNSWAIKFACQCNSNYDLRAGRLVEAVRMYPAAQGVTYEPTPQLEGFSYNKGYSSQGLAFLYPALPVTFSNSGQFKFRIRYAGEKFPAETTDSFRVFNLLDFKDTDGHGGEINNLKTKDGRTIVWQNKAVDTVPILERQVVSGLSGEATTIGTGGVVDRFDPISSYYGNQHQWGLTEAEYGYFWFDMRKKAVVILDFGSGIQEISLAEGLSAHFNEAFLEVLGYLALTSNVVNSQTFDETSDRPLVGVGITGVYDPKFKMSYLTFKFYSREPESMGGFLEKIAKDFTIGYYHPAKMFTSFYDWTPGIAHNHNQWVFASKNPQNKTRYYGPNMDSTSFIVGDVVAYNNAEYICILALTIASYPGLAAQIPDAVGSIYWVRINQTHEIWVNNMPKTLGLDPAPDYEYSKFFGQVVNGEIILIINPETENSFSVLNIEQHGNNENITDIYTETQYLTASETSITSTNRFYKWIYDKICSSLPLSSTGVRLTDMYLQVKLVKKNWSTVPYTRTRDPKILEMIVSYYEQKR